MFLATIIAEQSLLHTAKLPVLPPDNTLPAIHLRVSLYDFVFGYYVSFYTVLFCGRTIPYVCSVLQFCFILGKMATEIYHALRKCFSDKTMDQTQKHEPFK